MAETKDFLFLFPIITAAVLLLSLLFPIMSVSIYYSVIPFSIAGDLSPFGAGIMEQLEPYLLIEPDLSGLQMGLLFIRIAFIVFFILGALLLIISGIRVKTGNRELKKARKKWLRNGIFYIIGNILLYVFFLYGIPFSLEQLGITINLGVIMGIGMILTYVAGGILILAYILAKISE
ncbi:MAG: hypothetical protein JSV62_10770 [Promethearchaeota archaeon]|nr:MAG: hypothetical protein JSV62_10770 [Candidatus Lokiarchaeota archaeon]